MAEVIEKRGTGYSVPVAVATGMLVFLLLCFLGFPALSPETWNDVSASAGLRPPSGALGGLVRGVELVLFRNFPPAEALLFVRVAGWVLGAVTAVLGFGVLAGFCGDWVDRFHARARERLVVNVSLVTATLAFITADAVWYQLQGLSAVALDLCMMLLGTRFLQLFVRSCRRRYALLAMFCWTLLAVDTFVGILGVACVTVIVFAVNRRRQEGTLQERLQNPLVRIVLQRGLMGVFLLTLVAGLLVLTGPMLTLDGFAGIPAESTPRLQAVFGYLSDGLALGLSSASWKQWLLAFIVILAPVVVARILRDRSINDEDFLPAKTIGLHIILGLVAWTQVSGVKALRFDNWFEVGGTINPLLASVFAFLASLTLLWAMLVLGAAVFLKNPRTMASFRYADAAESAEGERALTMLDRVRRYAVPATAFVPVLMVGLMLGLRSEPTLRQMMAVVDEFLVMSVDECAGMTRVFTDGKLDAGLELEAFRRGEQLYTVSLLAGSSSRDLALRNRGLADSGDLRNSSLGAMNLLRAWVNDTPERLSDAAFSLAFELWQKTPEQLVYLGSVARTSGSAASLDVAACHRRAHEQAERVLAIYAAGNPDRAGTATLREVFRVVQWRLARLAMMRAKAAGRETWGADAAREQDLADRLCKLNSSYAALNRFQNKLESSGPILTPREGLRLGLDRADFKLAAVFAERVILSQPNDPQANFALGMHYFMAGDHARAEPYLRTCLEGRPDDPAVLNNLAVVELRLGRLGDAEKYAREALARLPESVQIKRTLEAVAKARAERGEEASK